MLLPLAEFSPLSADFQLNIWNVLLFVSTLATLWAAIRRKPPLDARLTEFSASIAGLKGSVDKLTKAQEDAAGHAARIAQLERECGELRAEIDRKTTEQRQSTDESMHDLYLRIEGFESATARNFQTIERSLGRIEGELKTR